MPGRFTRSLVLPTGSIPIVLSLALGMSGVTLAFEVLQRTFAPCAVPRGICLVELMQWDRQLGVRFEPPLAVVEEWAHSLRSSDGVSGYTIETSTLREPAGARPIHTLRAAPGFFELLGEPARLGRGFSADESVEGAGVALVSSRLARLVFGGEQAALHESLTLDGRTVTVVGILPRRLEQRLLATEAVDIAVPLGKARPERLDTFARLKPGFSISQLQLEVANWRGSQGDGGGEGREWVALTPKDRLDTTTLRMLQAAGVGAAILLLVTLANVAHLVAAGFEVERREIATRWAVGAGRAALLAWRARRALLLSLPASLAAAALALVALRMLAALAPDDLRFLFIEGIGPGALVLVFGVGYLSLLAMTTLPMAFRRARSFRRDLATDPRLGRPSAVGGFLGIWHLASMFTSSFVLSVLAALLVLSLSSLGRSDLGFRLEGLEVLKVELPRWKYPDGNSRRAFGGRARERLAALPGVRMTALVSSVPPLSGLFLGRVDLGNGVTLPAVGRTSVGPEYFRTVGQRLLAGRELRETEVGSGSKVVLVSASLAKALAGTARAAIGRRILFGSESREVIGVVADLKAPAFLQIPVHQTYWPIDQPRSSLNLVVRRSGRSDLAPRRAVAALDSDVVVETAGARELLVRSLEGTRFLASLFTLLTALSVLLSLLGAYAALSLFARRQSGPIAIRLALGATRRAVRLWLARRGLLPAALGIVPGFVLSFPAAKLIAAQLYRLEPGDLPTRFLLAVALCVLCLLALWRPAVQASRTEPTELLRNS